MKLIPATTVPTAVVREHYADCSCGATLYLMLGQVAATCAGCGGHYPITELGYNESREVASIWHEEARATCEVLAGPSW